MFCFGTLLVKSKNDWSIVAVHGHPITFQPLSSFLTTATSPDIGLALSYIMLEKKDVLFPLFLPPKNICPFPSFETTEACIGIYPLDKASFVNISRLMPTIWFGSSPS